MSNTIKTLIVSLIPGMYIRRIFSPEMKYNLNEGIAQKRIRVAIQLGISILFLIGGLAIGLLLIGFPLVSALGLMSTYAMSVILLASSLAVGLIFAEMGFLLAKQALRFFSWLKYHKDPTIINPTYPEKYLAKNVGDKDAMRQLYLAKQEIKNNPKRSADGLSVEEQRMAIDYAVNALRERSLVRLFKPVSFLISDETNTVTLLCFKRNNLKATQPDLRAQLAEYHNRLDQSSLEKRGMTQEMQSFLKTAMKI